MYIMCFRSLVGIAGSNRTVCMGGLSLEGGVCCQVEVSATGLSLVQRSPTDCDVSECDSEASILSRPWPTGFFGPSNERKTYV